MKPEMSLKIKKEVKKQFDVGFLAVARYPEWVANIVPVPKKDGKVRMCVDYRNLNRVSPKDNFPLPHIGVLVERTCYTLVWASHHLRHYMLSHTTWMVSKMDPVKYIF